MHKSVFSSIAACAQSSFLYTRQIPQQILCGEFSKLRTVILCLIRSLYTRFFIFSSLLAKSCTRFAQGLLLRLLPLNKLIEGIQ